MTRGLGFKLIKSLLADEYVELTMVINYSKTKTAQVDRTFRLANMFRAYTYIYVNRCEKVQSIQNFLYAEVQNNLVVRLLAIALSFAASLVFPSAS